ncbi:uncharacterized protein LOC131170226 [Hevea brasiliensis]|uniref:uncharacterized protein LOC131170226 n=1 Tax=Hevea brasiliensis TaxID=3981 RepID=UPI0025EA8907|nr:uncharacterized protein LOC131170226 [Hevea brasiliensis]
MDQPQEAINELCKRTNSLSWNEVTLELDTNDKEAESVSTLILVGKVLATRSFPINHVRNILNQVWNLAFDFNVKNVLEYKNTFLFTFKHERDKQRVLEGIPWSVSNALLILKSWSPHLKIEKVDFSTCLFWVQVHGLSRNQMTRENALKIGKIFHGVLDTDLVSNYDVSIGTCMRIRVDVDKRKPLFVGFTNRSADGSLERVRFRFKRLPDFCYMCGLLGHQIQTCPNINQVTRSENKGKRQELSPWMRAKIFSSKPKKNPTSTHTKKDLPLVTSKAVARNNYPL